MLLSHTFLYILSVAFAQLSDFLAMSEIVVCCCRRLPPSLVMLTGLSSLSILAAEFAYDEDTDLYVFDVSSLAMCGRLHTLLLELHGAKSSQHDLRGLAQLQHLKV